jgi:hypothetical protein
MLFTNKKINKKNKRKIIILKLNNLVVWSIGKAGRIHLMLAFSTGEALPATRDFSLNNQREQCSSTSRTIFLTVRNLVCQCGSCCNLLCEFKAVVTCGDTLAAQIYSLDNQL